MGCGWVVIDGYYVRFRGTFSDRPDHAFCTNMVGKAAKGLGADDIGVACMHQIEHLGGQKPAFSHLHPVVDQAVIELLHFGIGNGHGKPAGFLHCLACHVLDLEELLEHKLGDDAADPASSIVAPVDDGIVRPIIEKSHHGWYHDLASLSFEIRLEVVIAQWGVFHIDFTDNTDFDLGLFPDLNRGKLLANLIEIAFHCIPDIAPVMGESLAEVTCPGFDQGIGFALVHFVRSYLIGKGHQQVSVDKCAVRLQQHEKGELEAGILLHPLEVQADYRDVGELTLLQRLAQQKQVVARPAAPSGLGDDQSNLVCVEIAVLDRVDELADDELGWIADVIVYISEAFADDVRPLVLKQDDLVTVIGKDLLGDVEMNRRHVGYEDGIILFHCFGEYGTHWQPVSPIAASRLRILIFTAPRFAISSIFIWV